MQPKLSARCAEIRPMKRIAKLICNERGATAVEYGLILAMIFLAMIVGLTALSGSTTSLWGNISERVTTA